MTNVVPFPRKFRSAAPPPTDRACLVRLKMDLNAAYDTVSEVVKDDPPRRDQLHSMTRNFMCDIARIGGPQT